MLRPLKQRPNNFPAFEPEYNLWACLKSADRPLCLYGTGNGADRIIDEMNKRNIPLYGIFASSGFVRNRTFRGFPVKSYDYFAEKLDDFIVITAFGTNLPDVTDNIKRIAAERRLYSADVPVFGDVIFDDEFVNSNIEKLCTVYENLADEKSKQTYRNILLFKYTGVLDYLFAAESDSEERYEILNLSDNEIYLDLGAYNGDSALDFFAHTKKFQRQTLVEPNPKTFLKLQNNIKCENTNFVNCCISNYCGETEFSIKQGRGSCVGKGVRVPVRTVDSLGTDFTYIKADIEGNEKAMLEGMTENFRHKPKLVVSAYHRTEDLFTLPLKILEKNPEYKIYYRHYPYIPAWDCEFIAI